MYLYGYISYYNIHILYKHYYSILKYFQRLLVHTLLMIQNNTYSYIY